MKKVSVIIPCYNGERTIGRCFKSVLSQTYRNLEIIFVNDGSTDNTLSIVKNYAKTDSRIRIENLNLNKGVSSARNLGITLATGDYIQFVDSDDEMRPTMVETMLNELESNHADIAVCNFVGNPMFITYFEDRLFDLTNENDLIEYYENTFCMLLPWNKIFRKEILTTKFDEEVHFAEDELFNLAVLKDVKKVVCINQPLYVYHYAPAELMDMSNVEEKSCLNKIIDGTDGESQNGIWYMGNDLVPKRSKIIENRLLGSKITRKEDILYTRVFDFYFAELSALCFNGVDKEFIIKETMQIFQEKDFINSIKVQEKYGLKFIQYKVKELEIYVEAFINHCVACHRDILEEERDLNFYDIFEMLFVKYFCVECTRTSNKYNRLFQIHLQQEANATDESKYYNYYMKTNRFSGERAV